MPQPHGPSHRKSATIDARWTKRYHLAVMLLLSGGLLIGVNLISPVIGTAPALAAPPNEPAPLVAVQAGTWPQFRGPSGTGRAPAGNLPVSWSETEHILWKTPIHDRGWSSPVIADQQIWLTTATADGKRLYAVAANLETGAVEHDLLLFEVAEPRPIHLTNSYASCTPVISEDRVFISFGSYGTACLDRRSGAVIWQRRDLPCNHFRGPGSSPILFGDLLIMHFDGFDFQYVVALDSSTGETVWRRDREIDYGTDNGDFMKAYCTPLVIRVNDQWQLISPTSKATLAYDPLTGEELWRVRYDGFSATARPLYDGQRVYINTGFSKATMLAIAPTGRGDLTSQIAWTQRQSVGSKPSAILHGGLLFGVHDSGVASCWSAETGERVWAKRVPGNYSASLLLAGEHLYLFNEEGGATVLQASPEFTVVAENQLDDGCMASPAVADDTLLVRTKTHLYRIGQRAVP